MVNRPHRTVVKAGLEETSLGFRELVLTYEAKGALEVIMYFCPGSAGGDSLFGASQFFVVFPAANVTYIFHKSVLLENQSSSVIQRPWRLQ